MSENRAIIGLGNPGRQYQNTRHNCGFRFVDAVAEQCGTLLRPAPRLKANLVRTRISEVPVCLAQPVTYMNESGAAFHLVTGYYAIASEHTIVVHDDIDLPVGTVRIKSGGGHGGHNGIRDIIEKTGVRDFIRIRIGIGRPPGATIPYVLGVPPAYEQAFLDEATAAVLHSLPKILKGELERAMNELHSRCLKPADAGDSKPV